MGGVWGEEVWNKKRTLILFGCYWCLKSAKEALTILFFAGLMCDRQVLMIVSLQYFLKQDTFVILTYFWWVWFFYFLFFFMLRNLYFAKVPSFFRRITRRLWSMQSTDTELTLWNLWRIILLSLESQSWFRMCFVNENPHATACALKTEWAHHQRHWWTQMPSSNSLKTLCLFWLDSSFWL